MTDRSVENLISILHIQPRPGHLEDLIDCFERLQVGRLAVERAGCLEVRLLRPMSDDGDVIVISVWRRQADHESWLTDPVRAQLGPELAEYSMGASAGPSPSPLYRTKTLDLGTKTHAIAPSGRAHLGS